MGPHLADDEDVGEPGGEAVARAVLDVNHVEGAGVTLPVGDHADTPQVSTSGDHAEVTWWRETTSLKHTDVKTFRQKFWQSKELTGVKLDEVCNLASLQVDADRVVDLDEGVGVADGAGVVGHQVRDSLSADHQLLHLAQLVLQRKRRRVRKGYKSPSS